MTQTLKHVVAIVETLPPERQDKIAELIQAELDEQDWNALFATPVSERFIQELADEARREVAAGKTRDMAEGW